MLYQERNPRVLTPEQIIQDLIITDDLKSIRKTLEIFAMEAMCSDTDYDVEDRQHFHFHFNALSNLIESVEILEAQKKLAV